jgi:hypothetical protein
MPDYSCCGGNEWGCCIHDGCAKKSENIVRFINKQFTIEIIFDFNKPVPKNQPKEYYEIYGEMLKFNQMRN